MEPKPPEVEVYGALRAMMHEADVGPKVELASLVSPGRIGVGALSELAGEVTFDGERLWLSRPEQGAIATERITPGQPTAAAAALLVTSTVADWRQVSVKQPLALEGLGRMVAEQAAGMRTTAPLPFKVTGVLEGLRYHVVDGASLPEGPSSHAAHRDASVQVAHGAVPATLVGFWSTEHAGVFTHMGEEVHVHVTVEEPLGSGHVDAVTIPAGATLWLPQAASDG